MDFLSVATKQAAVAILPSSIFRTFNCTSKRLAGSPKELKLIRTCPTQQKLLPSTRILIYIDGLLSVAPNQAKLFFTFFHFPERSIALVKRLAGSPKGAEIDLNLPHANKKLLQGSTRILIYIDGLLSVAPNCAQAVAIFTFFHSRTFNCTSKTTGWFTKGAEIDPNLPHANKVVLQGSTRILIYIDGLLSVAPNCGPSRCYLPSIFLNVQLHQIDPN
jgi:hypothetical protein